MKFIYRLLKIKESKKKAVVINNDTAFSTSILQGLEPRLLFDAALGAELAAAISNQTINQSVDIDLVNSSIDTDHAMEALMTEFTAIDSNDQTTISDSLQSDFENYYSFDKSLVKELLFVDSNIDNYAELIEGVDLNKLVSGELEVIVLDANKSGIDQITSYLSQYDNQIESIHIVSHGSSGELLLGSDTVNNASLGNFSEDLSVWNNSCTNSADILFYGCSVAEGVIGQKFVQNLHDIVKTDIAASSDLTGAVNLDGDWELEVVHGEVTASLAFSALVQNNYQNILATYTVTNLNDSGAGSLRQAILDSNTTTTVDDTIEFSVAGTINLLSALPTLTDSVTIDASTAPGYVVGTPVVILTGSLASSTDAITVASTANNTTIKGFEFAFSSGNTSSNPIEISSGSSNITITENYFNSSVTNMVGLQITGGANLSITNNTFTGTNYDAISSYGVITNLNISGNTISGSTGIGMYIGSSNASASGVISNNQVFNNTTYGIYVVVGGNNTDFDITNNEVYGNNATGIALWLDNYSGYGVISNNEVYNNNGGSGASGIFIYALVNTYYDISQNSLYGNIGFSGTNANDIDLQYLGFNSNDTNDPDTGANLLQNYPVLTSAVITGTDINIIGTLNSATGETYRIDFYGTDTTNLTRKQGQTYLGSTTVTITDNVSPYDASFNVNFSNVAATNTAITATATRTTNLIAGATGATSEFSVAIAPSIINSPPVITSAGTTSFNLVENTSITASSSISVQDLDLSNTVNAAVASNANAGTYAGVFNGAGLVTLSVNPVINNSSTTGTLNWAFNSGGSPQQFDFLAAGETLVLNYTITFTDTNGATVSQPIQFTVNGVNNIVTIANNGNAVENGASGSFIVNLSSIAGTDTVVSYNVTGDATSNLDYTALSGTVTILAGNTSALINVNPLNDSIIEAVENVTVTLSAISSGDSDAVLGATVTSNVTITDDDSALVTLVATDNLASEEGVNGKFTVSMSSISSSNTVVSYTVTGTAQDGVDYNAMSGQATILAGQSSIDIDIDVVDDSLTETTENVTITLTGILSGNSGILLGTEIEDTISITDNDDNGSAPILASLMNTSSSGPSTGTGGGASSSSGTATTGGVNTDTGDGSVVESASLQEVGNQETAPAPAATNDNAESSAASEESEESGVSQESAEAEVAEEVAEVEVESATEAQASSESNGGGAPAQTALSSANSSASGSSSSSSAASNSVQASAQSGSTSTSTGGVVSGGSTAAGGSNLAGALGSAVNNAFSVGSDAINQTALQVSTVMVSDPVGATATAVGGSAVTMGATYAAASHAAASGAASAASSVASSSAAQAAATTTTQTAAGNMAQTGVQNSTSSVRARVNPSMHSSAANTASAQSGSGQQQDFSQDQDVQFTDKCRCPVCVSVNKIKVRVQDA